jgi:hypothetical protein
MINFSGSPLITLRSSHLLTLALLMLGVGANNANHALAPDDLALGTNFSD